MAQAPLRQCSAPGCRTLTRESRCPKHAKRRHQHYDKNRPAAAARGYDARWRKARAAFLASNPLCRTCSEAGRIVPATVVDHVVPHRGNEQLFWDQSNWQPLCRSCHSKKTARGE